MLLNTAQPVILSKIILPFQLYWRNHYLGPNHCYSLKQQRTYSSPRPITDSKKIHLCLCLSLSTKQIKKKIKQFTGLGGTGMVQWVKPPSEHLHPILECWFKCQPLCFWSSCLMYEFQNLEIPFLQTLKKIYVRDSNRQTKMEWEAPANASNSTHIFPGTTASQGMH